MTADGNGCTGYISAIPRLDFPGLCLKDAGQGIRATDLVSSFPSAIHVGASFNKELAGRRAYAMAGEYRRKGVNVLLGPSIGPLGRIVTGGRIWEGFSVDPYLTGVLVYETVVEAQRQGIMTSTKVRETPQLADAPRMPIFFLTRSAPTALYRKRAGDIPDARCRYRGRLEQH